MLSRPLNRWRDTRVEKNLAFQYTAPGGERVEIPRFVRPCGVLQVAQNASFGQIKEAYGMLANHSSRQKRAMASLSYNILASKVDRYQKKSRFDGSYEINQGNDVIVIAAVGDTARLLSEISRNKSLLTVTDEHSHTLLYLTARSGFYDTTEALLHNGVPVNQKQVDGSTPLHAASFYGQRHVVELLLRYGADPTIMNRWGNTPSNEVRSDEIKQVILKHKQDHISQIICSLMGKGFVYTVRLVERRGKLIGKEVLRHPDTLDHMTKQNLDFITSRWITLWHGTICSNLESILLHGLLPSGTKLRDGSTIRPPDGHIKLGVKHFGFVNWANAIFLSPSIGYASNQCYSERIWSGGEKWCILIKAHVNPSAYTTHGPTLLRYHPVSEGEPVSTEYRIQVTQGDTIMRVESARNVVVTSIVFISLDFLENTPNLTFEELKSLFHTEHL